MIKFFQLLIICASCCGAYGESCYIGPQFTYLQQKLSLTGNYIADGPGDENRFGHKGGYRKSNVIGLVAGCHFYRTNLVLCGAEVNVNYSFINEKVAALSPERNGYDIQARRKLDVMPALFVKYRAGNFNPYLKAGFEIVQFQFKERVVLDDGAVDQLVKEQRKNSWQTRFILAVGQDIPLCQFIDLRMEAFLSSPGKRSSAVSDWDIDAQRRLSTTRGFKVGVLYKF